MLLKRLSLGTADLPSIVFVLFLLQQQLSFIPTAAGQELNLYFNSAFPGEKLFSVLLALCCCTKNDKTSRKDHLWVEWSPKTL